MSGIRFRCSATFYVTAALTFLLGSLLLPAFPGVAGRGDKPKDSKGGMNSDMLACMPDMNGVDMTAMGPSMAAMACHMYITPLRAMQPGDEERAKAVVAAALATMERYKDYRKAIADGRLSVPGTLDELARFTPPPP